jgi:hypothetical protein
MTKCGFCKKDYDGELEDHLIAFHITRFDDTARYLAYLVGRIQALERGQKRGSI